MNRELYRDLHRRARMDKRGEAFAPAPLWLDGWDIVVWASCPGQPASVYRDGPNPRSTAATLLGLCREARADRSRYWRRQNHRKNLSRSTAHRERALPLP